MVYAVKLILTIERIREFAISVQLITYAKQNGVKYTTISATGTMTQIGWRRLLLGHGDEVGSTHVYMRGSIERLLRTFENSIKVSRYRSILILLRDN